MLVRDATDDDRGREILKRALAIQRSSTRMTRLAGDLLDVVSIEAGKLAVDPAPEDATRLAAETIEAFQPSAPQRNLVVSEVAADSLLARFDYERILQVLANLVGNAMKFTPTGGRVTLRVQPLGGEVQFSWRIPVAVSPKQRPSRSSNGSRRRGTGHGKGWAGALHLRA